MRPLLFTAALLLAALLPACTQAQSPAPVPVTPTQAWTSCAGKAAAALFRPDEVLLSNATATPGLSMSFALNGALNQTVTGGAAQLRVTSDRGAGAPATLFERFGPLSELLSSALPIAAGRAALVFPWEVPRAEAGVLAPQDHTLMVRLEALDQSSASFLCVTVALPLEQPPPAPEAPPAKASTSKLLGYGCALISVVFFGTNFLPVKAFDTGDGVFFQWMLCLGVWCCGLGVQLVRGSAFEPFAMLGGLMWCVGNMTSVPVIQCIGLGIGMSIWGGTGLVMGWASGRFGFLGVKEQAVENKVMNVLGLLSCVASLVVMFQVKSVKDEQSAAAARKGSRALLSDDSLNLTASGLLEGSESYAMQQRRSNYDGNGSAAGSPVAAEEAEPEVNWTDKLSPGTRRLVGITLAIMAGCLYGLSFNPAQYLIDSGKGASGSGIDYVFSHFCGILVGSTAYMLSYTIYKRNLPQVLPNIVLPGLASGMGWAVAQISWFVANDQIHFVGTFPLVSCGPGIIATLCAIVFYKEIQGTRNFLLLALATCITAVGVLLIASSLPADS